MAAAPSGVKIDAGTATASSCAPKPPFLRLCATLHRNSSAPRPWSFDKLMHSSYVIVWAHEAAIRAALSVGATRSQWNG
jgi:hypothetical protein